jgi:hypothetical protein
LTGNGIYNGSTITPLTELLITSHIEYSGARGWYSKLVWSSQLTKLGDFFEPLIAQNLT